MTKKAFARCFAVAAVAALYVFSLHGASNKVRVIQTNSAGDNIHLIDPATNKVVGEIKGIEVSHGVSASPDGSRLYVSNESINTVDVVDVKTLKVTQQIPLSGNPNNITITPDGKKVYVAIIQAPGAVDVIDVASLKKIKTIPTQGGIHNLYATPDGKFVAAGSPRGHRLNVIDTHTDEIAWSEDLGLEVRPMTFVKNPDGSTKWIFVQSTFNGFVVVDFVTHKQVRRIDNPEIPAGYKTISAGADESHGIAVTADGKTLVVVDHGGQSRRVHAEGERGRHERDVLVPRQHGLGRASRRRAGAGRSPFPESGRGCLERRRRNRRGSALPVRHRLCALRPGALSEARRALRQFGRAGTGAALFQHRARRAAGLSPGAARSGAARSR